MTKINVIQPGTIEAPPGDIPFLLLPERNVFQARGARLKSVALRQEQKRDVAGRRLDGSRLNNIDSGHFVPLVTSRYQPGW